VFKKHCRQR